MQQLHHVGQKTRPYVDLSGVPRLVLGLLIYLPKANCKRKAAPRGALNVSFYVPQIEQKSWKSKILSQRNLS